MKFQVTPPPHPPKKVELRQQKFTRQCVGFSNSKSVSGLLEVKSQLVKLREAQKNQVGLEWIPPCGVVKK